MLQSLSLFAHYTVVGLCISSHILQEIAFFNDGWTMFCSLGMVYAHTRPTKIQTRKKNPSTDKQCGPRVSSLTKKLFEIDTFWEREKQFSSMEYHWVYISNIFQGRPPSQEWLVSTKQTFCFVLSFHTFCFALFMYFSLLFFFLFSPSILLFYFCFPCLYF